MEENLNNIELKNDSAVINKRIKVENYLANKDNFNKLLKKMNSINDITIKAKNFLWMALYALTGKDRNVIKGSDLKIQVGDYPFFNRKKAGGWVRDERFGIITKELVNEIFNITVPENLKSDYIKRMSMGDTTLDYDYALTLNFNDKYKQDDPRSMLFLVDDNFDINLSLSRFRVNTFLTDGNKAFIIRIIDSEIPKFENLNLPEHIKQFTELSKGLVLVTGPTGSGKSTTLASLLQLINEKYNKNIITLEDPVEFKYKNCKSTFSQREIGKDCISYARGLKSALREAPDIILIGEMRDLETISLAIEAAETGHLVFGTLHTFNAAKTIDRIISQFPEAEQNQVAQQLGTALVGVISQTLIKTLPDENGVQGICSLNEVVRINNPARQNIKEKKSDSIIQSVSGDPRSLTMIDHALMLSVTKKKVSPKTLMNLFYQSDINTYQLYVDMIKKAGLYNELEDPKFIEEQEKKIALNKLKLSANNTTANNTNLKMEEFVEIKPINSSISISS